MMKNNITKFVKGFITVIQKAGDVMEFFIKNMAAVKVMLVA